MTKKELENIAVEEASKWMLDNNIVGKETMDVAIAISGLNMLTLDTIIKLVEGVDTFREFFEREIALELEADVTLTKDELSLLDELVYKATLEIKRVLSRTEHQKSKDALAQDLKDYEKLLNKISDMAEVIK